MAQLQRCPQSLHLFPLLLLPAAAGAVPEHWQLPSIFQAVQAQLPWVSRRNEAAEQHQAGEDVARTRQGQQGTMPCQCQQGQGLAAHRMGLNAWKQCQSSPQSQRGLCKLAVDNTDWVLFSLSCVGKVQTAPGIVLQNPRIMEWFSLEGTLKLT